jgi:phage tail sheath gpL-like
LRAVNSLKKVLGENQPAWLTLVSASATRVSLGTAVTLTGRLPGSCGSFWAVTVIGGSAVVKGVCAAAGEQMSQDASNPHDAATLRVLFGIREFSHIF